MSIDHLQACNDTGRQATMKVPELPDGELSNDAEIIEKNGIPYVCIT